MLGDQSHRFLKQLFARRNAMPRRRAGRMRQRDHVECAALAPQPERAADHLIELADDDELRDRELADRR